MSEDQQEFEFVHQETEINERSAPEKVEMLKRVEKMMEEALPRVQEMLTMKEDAQQMMSEVADLLKEIDKITKRLSD